MSVKIKICGLTHEDDVKLAIKLGADALGFIFYPKSPRFVSVDRFAELVKDVPSFVTVVGVGVNLSRFFMDKIEKKARVDLWQLHGEVSLADFQTLGRRRYVYALGFPLESARLSTKPWNSWPVEAFLLDKKSTQHGGTGQVFDWSLAVDFKKRTQKPIILSGGLSPENVAEAIQTVNPYAVDVCSGVEATPGRKDHQKLAAFIQKCRNAA